MIETVILIIFVVSLGGVLFILAHKLPVLASLPQNRITSIREHKLVLACKDKIKNILTTFEKQIFFHKFLSWVKVMTLKIETRVDHLLHKIRKKNQQMPS